MIAHLDDPPAAAELFVRFELLVLEELGFGLDLERCAATGVSDDLAYVSPKSGRAVNRAAGTPWQDRLLALPAFLRPGARLRGTPETLAEAFRLTGYFMNRNLYEPRGIAEPTARASFLAALSRLHSNGENAA
jgi:DNA repair protein RecO (recombination protein O)